MIFGVSLEKTLPSADGIPYLCFLITGGRYALIGSGNPHSPCALIAIATVIGTFISALYGLKRGSYKHPTFSSLLSKRSLITYLAVAFLLSVTSAFSKKGYAFNLHITTEKSFFTFDEEAIIDYCSSLKPHGITTLRDLDPSDITLFLHKTPPEIISTDLCSEFVS